MKTSKKSETERAQAADRVCRALTTYGRIEHAAGVTDRAAFWKGHRTEETARTELRRLIAERLRTVPETELIRAARESG